MADEYLDLLYQLWARHPRLGELRGVYRVRDVGINYNRASVAEKVFYVGPEPEDERDSARYRGRDFERYTAVHRGGWLRHDGVARLAGGERLALAWETYQRPEKIVMRQTADRLVATLDRSRMAMGRSVIAITAETDVSLPALLACLNSTLMTGLYHALTGEKGRILPQVKVARLHALPLPRVCVEPVNGALRAKASALLSANRPDIPSIVDGNASLSWALLDYLADLQLKREGRDPELDQLTEQVVSALYDVGKSTAISGRGDPALARFA